MLLFLFFCLFFFSFGSLLLLLSEWLICWLCVYEVERSVVWSGEEKRLMSKDWKIEWSWFQFSFRGFFAWDGREECPYPLCCGRRKKDFSWLSFTFFHWWFIIIQTLMRDLGDFCIFHLCLFFFKLSSYVWASVMYAKRHIEIHTFIHHRRSIGSRSVYCGVGELFFAMFDLFVFCHFYRHANFFFTIIYLISFPIKPVCESLLFLNFSD